VAKPLKTRSLNEMQSGIPRLFYEMRHFGANESFCDRFLIMLQLVRGWREKFVRVDPTITNSVTDSGWMAEKGVPGSGRNSRLSRKVI